MPSVRCLKLALLGVLAPVAPTAAHGLGQRYDLPLPLWLYLLGAAGAVAASFVFLIAVRKPAARGVQRAWVLARGTLYAPLVLVAQGLAVGCFILVVAAGLFGNQKPFKNIAPTAVWVVWWVGFAFVCAFIGDVWTLLNPYRLMFEWADRLVRRCRGRGLSLGKRYPERLGVWPAAALLLAFAWVELAAPDRDIPGNVASGALTYAALMWIGCGLFGPGIWMRRGDAFSLTFAILGRFAPVRFVQVDGGWRWRLRPYAAGLLGRRPVSRSMTGFVLLMLATVSVDGFMETPPWAAVMATFAAGAAAPGSVPTATLLLPMALLTAAPGLFALGYWGIAAAMRKAAGEPHAPWVVAGRFVLVLVPIAVAYHLAHYLSYLLVAGQFIIPLASDPFGWGWDLFGTSLYRIDIAVVDAGFLWYFAVSAIVLGHALATWLAHETALQLFRDDGAARRSQYPMLALMIAYTVTSLWILSQPIVERR